MGHLERIGQTVRPEYGVLPPAPAFKVQTLDGKPLQSTELRGQVVALVFYLPTCPHCHSLLQLLGKLRTKLDGQPLRIVPVSLQNRPYVIRDMKRKIGIEYATYVDPTNTTQQAYSFQTGVPDTILIDREGRIAARTRGWRGREDGPLMRMRLAMLAGDTVPMLLRGKGYSGSEVCGVCHEREYETWKFTRHATAFDTLVKHGADVLFREVPDLSHTYPREENARILEWFDPALALP